MSMAAEPHALKRQILELVAQYYEAAHQRAPFQPGKSRVSYAGRVYDAHELVNLVDSSRDFWLTLGPQGARFEQRRRSHFGARDFLLVNSGSSANLLMVATLCANELDTLREDTDRPRLQPGAEVITPAVTS